MYSRMHFNQFQKPVLSISVMVGILNRQCCFLFLTVLHGTQACKLVTRQVELRRRRSLLPGMMWKVERSRCTGNKGESSPDAGHLGILFVDLLVAALGGSFASFTDKNPKLLHPIVRIVPGTGCR